jgi:hypothetical protein
MIWGGRGRSRDPPPCKCASMFGTLTPSVLFLVGTRGAGEPSELSHLGGALQRAGPPRRHHGRRRPGHGGPQGEVPRQPLVPLGGGTLPRTVWSKSQVLYFCMGMHVYSADMRPDRRQLRGSPAEFPNIRTVKSCPTCRSNPQFVCSARHHLRQQVAKQQTWDQPRLGTY